MKSAYHPGDDCGDQAEHVNQDMTAISNSTFPTLVAAGYLIILPACGG